MNIKIEILVQILKLFYKKVLISPPVSKCETTRITSNMRNKFLRNSLAWAAISALVLPACKDDSNLTVPPPPADQSFVESFDNFQDATNRGWKSVNNSFPLGRIWYDAAEVPNFGSPNYLVTYFPNWAQAQLSLDPLQFPNAPYPNRIWDPAFLSFGGSNGYAATSIAAASATSRHNVSNWLISPSVKMKNGDKIVFYTYSKGMSRIQLWINPSNTLNVGASYTESGDFTIKLLDINPSNFRPEENPALAFPTGWTRFEGTVQGLSAPVVGRFGFRHFLLDRPALAFSAVDPTDYDTLYTQIHRTVVGLDEVSFESAR
jgi:hypothetical protein